MPSPLHDKKPQGLYLSKNPDVFMEQFERAIGCSLQDLVGRLVSLSDVIGSFLVGSIPHGIGSSASDIDILVLLDSARTLRLPSPKSDDRVAFSAALAGDGARLVAGSVVTVLNSIEVDIEFVMADAVLELFQRLSGVGACCSLQQARVASRLKSGWVLTRSTALESFLERIRSDQSLEVHWTDRHLGEMLKLLDDAFAALPHHQALALHLGRLSVEAGFRAYLASRGYPALGQKWLRFLAPGKFEPLEENPQHWEELSTIGLPLLFPSLSGTDWLSGADFLGGKKPESREYLLQVRDFSLASKALLRVGSASGTASRLARRTNHA